MAKYRNLQDWKGSPDGVQVVEYPEGQEQELTEELAAAAQDEGWVEEVKDEKPKPAAKKAKPKAEGDTEDGDQGKDK